MGQENLLPYRRQKLQDLGQGVPFIQAGEGHAKLTPAAFKKRADEFAAEFGSEFTGLS
jgi:hypothetical protein